MVYTITIYGDCLSSRDIAVWILWTVMIVMHGVIMLVHGIGRLFLDNNFVDLCFSIIVMIVVEIAFGLYLLGDNAQPLDCYTAISPRNLHIMRLCFLSFSFIIYAAFTLVAGLCIECKKC